MSHIHEVEPHIIKFDEYGWTIQHPLAEREDGFLFSCPVRWNHDDPGVRGMYYIYPDGSLEEVEEEEDDRIATD